MLLPDPSAGASLRLPGVSLAEEARQLCELTLGHAASDGFVDRYVQTHHRAGLPSWSAAGGTSPLADLPLTACLARATSPGRLAHAKLMLVLCDPDHRHCDLRVPVGMRVSVGMLLRASWAVLRSAVSIARDRFIHRLL